MCTGSSVFPVLYNETACSNTFLQGGIVGATNRNDLKKLSELLQQKDKYGIDDMGRALQVAAERGLEGCCRLLLESKAIANLHDASGFTPVVFAAKQGHSKILELLIQFGADLNKPTYRVRATALHWAATNGHKECVEVLLSGGANPESRTIHGRTPLMLAARSDQLEIVLAIIEAGADVNVRDTGRATPLHLAAEEGCDDVVRVLLRAGALKDPEMKGGDTPIMKAAHKGHADVVERLILQDCDLTKRGRKMTILHWAAEGGSAEVIDLLILNGMDPNIITTDSYYGGNYMVHAKATPLMLAARNGHREAIKCLIERGAAIDMVDDEENTALLYSIRSKHTDCILELLRAGANPDGVPFTSGPLGLLQTGISPLFMCLKNNDLDSLKILLRANCDLNVRTSLKEGSLAGPAEFALLKGNLHAFQMLISSGLTMSMMDSDVLEEAIAWLIEEDEDICAQLVDKLRTPYSLMHCSRKAIRDRLGKRCLDDVEKLPLPPPLQKYVDFSDLENL